MIIALLTLVIPFLLGIGLLAWLRVTRELTSLILIGSIAGLALFTTGVFVLDIFFPITYALTIGLTISGFFASILTWQLRNIAWQGYTLDKTAVGVFVVLLALFAIIGPKLFIERPDGSLATGIINAYGDVAWHASIITTFAEEQTFPPQDPIFAGEQLTYPFLTNFLSALLLVGGASLAASITWPAIVLIPLLVSLLYCLVRDYCNNRQVAVITVLLFLFGGATLGFVRLPADFHEANTSVLNFFLHLPARDYSGVGTDEHGFHFLNPVTTLLLPQRSFLFGMPLAFAILILLIPRQQERASRYLVAGVLVGLLPLFHAHTALALVPAIIALFSLQPRLRPWLFFVIPAAIVSLPELIYYTHGQHEAGSFFRFSPGWMVGNQNILWYWLKNTGLLLPATLWSLILPTPRNLKGLAAAGLTIFIIANTWLFAPWAWDNFKLFVFFFIFTLPAAVWVTYLAWQKTKSKLVKFGICLILALQMLSAGLDIFKLLLPTARIWEEWSNEAVEAASVIQQVTKPGDIILTAPVHNSTVVLAGRELYLGFAAHVWSHGGNPWLREESIKSYYRGLINTVPDIRPQYVLVGPQEEYAFAPIAVHADWTLAAQSGPYFLYRITD